MGKDGDHCVAQGEAACSPFGFQHPSEPPPPYSEFPPPFNPAFIPPYAAYNWSWDSAGNATFMSAPELTAIPQWQFPERNRTTSESAAYPFSSEQQESDMRGRNGPEYRRSQSEPHTKRRKALAGSRRVHGISSDDDDYNRTTINFPRKRSNSIKAKEGAVMASWVVLWPLYLLYEVMRQSPVDEEDIQKDIVVAGWYRLYKRLSSNERH